MTGLGKMLTEENKRLLKMIYLYGGYVRVAHLDFIYPYITHRARVKHLDKLADMGYLVKKRLKTNSKCEPVTYQVTKRTCAMFEDSESSLCKRHYEEHVYMSLIKSRFCVEVHKLLEEHIVTSRKEIVELFKRGNFKEGTFPDKRFEELLLDFTQNKGLELRNNDKLLYDDCDSKIIIVYIDQHHMGTKQQIEFITKRYDLAKLEGDFSVRFLIVTDDEKREEAYKRDIDKHVFFSEYISKRTIELYKDVLCMMHINDTAKVKEIEESFSSGKLRTDKIEFMRSKKPFLISLNEQQKAIVEGVKLHGEKYIMDVLRGYYKTYKEDGNIKNFQVKSIEYFEQIFLLEYNKYISLETEKFEMKVYRIGKAMHW